MWMRPWLRNSATAFAASSAPYRTVARISFRVAVTAFGTPLGSKITAEMERNSTFWRAHFGGFAQMASHPPIEVAKRWSVVPGRILVHKLPEAVADRQRVNSHDVRHHAHGHHIELTMNVLQAHERAPRERVQGSE